jgi:polysaccharide biosynthesis PFTS motif protein
MTNVIFEHVQSFHLPFILYYLKKGCKVYIFDFNLIARKRKWLRELVDANRINKITPFISAKNNIYALESIEKVYSACFGQSMLIRAMSQLYQDPDITLAYKKFFIEQLSNFYTIQFFIQENFNKNQKREEVVFIPEFYSNIAAMLGKSSAQIFDLSYIKIPVWAKIFCGMSRFLERAKNFALLMAIGAFSILGIIYKIALGLIVKPAKKEYRYAIAIKNPSFQFKSVKSRTFDFILDHQDINKTNSCFVFLVPVAFAIKKRLRSDAYAYVDAQPMAVITAGNLSLNFSAGIRALGNISVVLSSAVCSIFFDNEFILFPTCYLLAEYLTWKVVSENYRFKNFITFNDEGMRHIARNIMLKHAGCMTWLYAHSSSLGYICASSIEGMKEYCHWLWAYLFYDFYVAWNKRMIEYQRLHRQKIGRYVNIGCLWSTLVTTSDVKDARSFIYDLGGPGKVLAQDSKVVSVFDTSFIDGVGSLFPVRHGIQFYLDMLKLLEEHKEFFMIIKEKKPARLYAQKDFLLYTGLHKDFFEILDRLACHPRAMVTGSGADSSEIIKVSDLVITYAFSSSTVEALSCRKKAIFYDPAGTLGGDYYYNTIPGLVCHGYDELDARATALLYSIDEKQYNQYLDEKMLFSIEDYLDGKALDRFRDLLIRA